MKRNKFSLSHYKLLSCNQGNLVPIGMYEVLPGDTVQQSTAALLRAAPLVAPVMHPVHCRIHHWFVPYRLLMDDWEDFITGGPDGADATVMPFITQTAPAVGSLADYLGVPTGVLAGGLDVSALPFRAYALIFNEWYRDQDLVTEIGFSTASGADVTTNTTLQSVAWEKDYFTSARPWEQKGAGVSVPVSTVSGHQGIFRNTSSGLIEGTAGNVTNQAGGGMDVAGFDSYYDPNGSMTIDVNDLRESMALQRYAEARARFGSRYSEYLRYLGVKSSDARLQRPEYLGGGKQTIQFSEVLQTAEGTNPVGMMRGHGIAAMRSNRYRRFFEEHGLVMTLLSVKPRTVYMDAIPRMWLRTTKEEFWQRELEHIGQQAISNAEVYAPAGYVGLSNVFGYQDRYDEYRRHESQVSGEFRSTLNYWHMARDLASTPTLNSSFVTADPTNRVYAATSAHQLYVMAQHSIQARRQVAKIGSSFIF